MTVDRIGKTDLKFSNNRYCKMYNMGENYEI